MGKLFCFPGCGRKGKDLDIELTEKNSAINLPLFVEDMIVACDTNSATSKEGFFVKGTEQGEGRSPVVEPLLCKPQIGTDQKAFVNIVQSSCVSVVHQDMPPDEASIHAKGVRSYEMGSQERSSPHSPQLGCGSCGGYKSESDAMGSECTRQSCTDSSSHPRKGIASSLADAEATEKGTLGGGMVLFVGQEEARRDAIFRYSPEKKAILSTRKFGWDDAMLGGHASDPGVYQGEEIQSLNSFSVLQDDGSFAHSLLLEGSPNPNSNSHMSGDAAENVSVETCGHCSEPTYHDVEVTNSRPDNLSVGHLPSSLAARLNQEASDTSPLHGGNLKQHPEDLQKLKGRADDAEEVGIFTVALRRQSLNTYVPFLENSLSRVEEWISTIQQPDLNFHEPTTSEIIEEVAESSSSRGLTGAAIMDRELASAAVQSLSVHSTVAHIAGIGLREVPSLGVFNCLKTLNLSANSITRVLAGCLPQSLHILDISRNRISQVEGFRELTRLRVLNLSHNRISRIGHGLGNCTLIKELYMAGNKIAEVDGLHRLLKLSILDLSHNKIATSKALGQLAANYSSLLALNLQGNLILANVGEDQLRKLVCSLTPHISYLNKQPIKAISVREAGIDNVARAALGASHRKNKSGISKAARKVAGVQPSTSTRKKLPSGRAKEVQKWLGSNPGRASRRLHNDNHHAHQSRDNIGDQLNKKVSQQGTEILLDNASSSASCLQP